MRSAKILPVLIALGLALSACSGGGDGDSGGASQTELRQRLAAAQKTIDDAESATVSLSTKLVPKGVSGLKSASGVATHAPAFKGKVSVVISDNTLDADVIAADGGVWAKPGISPRYLKIDPSDLRAPDPASLLGTSGQGIASLLTETTGLKEGDRSRDGSDVLTTVDGRIAGADVKRFLPSADQDDTFTVVYRLDEDDALRDATIKGAFYAGSPDVTYRLTIVPSDETVSIKAP